MTRRRAALALLSLALLWPPLVSPLAQEGEPGLVSVSGAAEVRVRPDQVIVTFGVESLSQDLSGAKADNDSRVARVIAAAKDQGVAAQKIETDYLQIRPDYQGRRKLETPPIYVVQRSVVVTLFEISRFEDLLSAALASGANYVHGIQFRTTKLRQHRDEARRQAMRAKEKAELLAAASGLDLGEARRIQEGGGGWWSTYGQSWGGGHRGFAAQNVTQAGGAGAEAAAAISAGEIAVSAQVSVTFALR